MSIAFLLLALGFGYKVFAEASKNTKSSLKSLGRVVGVFIMLVSLMGTLCAGYHYVKKGMFGKCSSGYGSYSKSCPHCAQQSGHKGECPKCAGHGFSSEKKMCPFASQAE